MKRSIKAIAAAAAALTMTFSCVPAVYAVGNAPAAQAEEESVTKLEFTEGKTFEIPYNGAAEVISEDGNVYYRGYDRENRRPIIYTLDEEGNMKNSYIIYHYVNDKGERIGVGSCTLKQCGDHLYLIYSESGGFSTGKNVIVKLDKELNEISRSKFPKSPCIDTNGEKVVYLKGEKEIYICDMDGKNNKLLYTANNSVNALEHEQPMNSVAIAGNYVGFQKRVGFYPKTTEYCGMINIETGKITLKKQRSVKQVFSSGDNLIWYGDAGYDTSEDCSVPADVTDIRAYMDSVYKYYDDSEFYIFDGENYSVLKTPNKNESGYGAVIDNEGNFITASFDGKGRKIFRIYRGGKLLGEHIVSYKGFSCFTANNGVITISYTGQAAAASDWVGFDLSTYTTLENEVVPDIAPVTNEIETMKSVTISYK